MNVFFISVFVASIILLIVTISAGITYAVLLSKGHFNEPVEDKEGHILFKKNINTTSTFLLGYRGGVRSFNKLFDKKQLKNMRVDDNDRR